ncbi:phosphate signaling complex protein PhoU [Heliobacillus mobilis]
MHCIEMDHLLKNLQHDLLRMGAMVEEAIYNGVQSLVKRDAELASTVLDGDEKINQLQLEIEDRCIKLIATQQPMAKDLRKISATWRISVDLERMADNVGDICKAVIRLNGQAYLKPFEHIPQMADLCQKMVKDGLDAYINEDVALAVQMSEMDHQVDTLYREIFKDLMEMMSANSNVVNQGNQLIFIARFLERFGDHATNIAESVVYLVTGQRKDLNK